MPKRHLPAAAALAGSGVVTRAQLVAARLDDDLGDRLTRQGSALRLAPSTYLLGEDQPDDLQLLAAARAHAGDDAVVTGALACRLLGLRDAPQDPVVAVLLGDGRRLVSSQWVRVHQTTRPPATWLHTSGLRVAEPHRAVVDAARALPTLQDVRALVFQALGTRWCGLDELRAELEAGPRAGTALCRRALADAEAGAMSAPEAELADVAQTAARRGRLPAFVLNPTLLVDGVVVGQPDGWFPGLGLGWEVDSRRHHAEDDDFDATLERHDRFGGHGLQLLHVTPRRARRLGPAYAEVLAAAVVARRAAAQPEPAGLVVRPYDPRGHVVRRLTLHPPRSTEGSPRSDDGTAA